MHDDSKMNTMISDMGLYIVFAVYFLTVNTRKSRYAKFLKLLYVSHDDIFASL